MRTPILAVAVVLSVTSASPRAQGRAFELGDLARIVRLADPQISPDGRSIALVVSRASLEENRWEGELALLDVASGAMRELTHERRTASQPRWSPGGDRLAFLATVGAG